MTINASIFTRLSTFAGLTALVGNRSFPVEVPQNSEYPAVSYLKITGERVLVMGVNSGLVRALFQFDCWSGEHANGDRGTYDEARAVADQVVKALDRWTNTVGTVVQDSIPKRDLDRPPEENGRLYHSLVEFEIFFEE